MSVKSIQSTDKSLWFDIGEINQIVQDIQATPFKDAETFDEKNYVLNSFWSEYIKASSGNLSQKNYSIFLVQ
jgi:Txe/YoeB family toxin of Txe-Axe toxin-antitoxin module